MKEPKRVLLIGGGSGGHIMPLIPLVRELKKQNVMTGLVSADQALDKKIVKEFIPNHVETFFLKTGKLRRYFDLKNITDIPLTLLAIFKAHKVLKEFKPGTLFIKGGFVGVPFVFANQLFFHRIPVMTHESDMTPGLAIKIANLGADQTIGNFTDPPYPLFYVPEEKPKNPYTTKRPKILVISGSLGGLSVNKIIEQESDKLLKKYHITVITGKGKKMKVKDENFEQFELLPPEKLADYLNHCDLVISRGGSNSLLEIINAKKPSIIIPLPSTSSRGDQDLNADHFAKQHLCHVLQQDKASQIDLETLIEAVLSDKKLKESLQKTDIELKAKEICEILIKR